MMENVFIGTNMTDVQFPPNCTCVIEILEKIEVKDHYITVGKKRISNIKLTNFHPMLEKGEIFILQTEKFFLKITVK